MKFLEALRAGETLLRQETLALMATQRLNPQQMETFTKKDTHGYGLGMRVPKAGGWHTDSPNTAQRNWVYEAVVEELTGERAPQSKLGDGSLTY